ncbi:MAG: sigma-70 family RNA polymerase sigma factor [Acidobacteriota bacterium]
MNGEQSDADLMSRARRGDRDAFAMIVDRYQNAIVGYAARLTGSRERAEDVGQETFLKLWSLAPRYDDRGRLPHLLTTIATNVVRSQERRARTARLFAPLFGRNGHGHGSTPEREALAGEEGRLVAAALASVPLAYRAPLVLHEIEGRPIEEVARILRCAEGTVKSRLHRGRDRMRAVLAAHWNGAGS